MLIVAPSRAWFCGLCASGLLGWGCKRHAPPPVARDAAPLAASALPSPEEATRCRRRPDFGLTLEAAAAPAKGAREATAAEDEDDDALVPFGVQIGAAISSPFGFALAGIRGQGQAFVALLGERGSHRIDLGELHGDPETPALAALGERLLVALRSTDAAGFTIKLGRIGGLESSAVDWGYELTKLGKVVTGIELAAAGTRGLLVYQTELKGDSRLMLGSFSTDALSEPFEPKPLEPKDVEDPRLLPRAGGYWLSWVRTLTEPKKPAVVAKTGESAPDPEERELLDLGLRVVEVVKLDERGTPLGAALRVGEPRRQVLLYDVAATGAGLLVAARSDSAAPGAERGAVLLSQIAPDGSVREERVDDDELGAGAPVLLVDADASLPGPWLSVSAPSDATRVGLAQGARTSLRADPLLGRAEVIAVGFGHFLVERARGVRVTLEALDCSWPAEAAEKK